MLAYISSSTQLLTGLLLFVYKSHLYISQSREKIDPNHLVQMYWQQWLGVESSLLEVEEAYGNFSEFKFELIAALSIMFNYICWVMFNICLVLMRLKIDFCSCVLLFCCALCYYVWSWGFWLALWRLFEWSFNQNWGY